MRCIPASNAHLEHSKQKSPSIPVQTGQLQSYLNVKKISTFLQEHQQRTESV